MISDSKPKIKETGAVGPGPNKRRLSRSPWMAALYFLIFVACLGGLVATLFLDLLNNYGVVYGRDLPRIPYTNPADLNGANPLGVNTSLHLETDPAAIDRTLDLIKAGGYGFIRQGFPWEYIEPQRGQFDWAKFDAIVEKASSRNLQIIARLDRPPFWAREKEYDRLKEARPKDFNGITGPPENYEDYALFVAEVADRYKGKLKFYQIWNEPNLANEWNDRRVNPADYVKLLQQTYPKLKQTDPGAVVLAAPLSPTDQDGPQFNNLNELKYLEEMYRAGAKAYFDILTVQIYGLGYPPDFRLLHFNFNAKDWKRVNLNRAAASREVMVKNGDSNKPVWATEYGWISVPPGPYLDDYNNPQKGNQQWGESKTEQEQADYLVGGLERARKEWPWLGVVNVWFFRADPPLSARPQDPTNYFALVKPDFQPRPAYYKLQAFAAQEYKRAGTGWHAATDPAISYSNSQNNSLSRGDTLNFSFEGERAEIVFTPKNDGELKVSTDGSPAKTISFKLGGETRLTLAEGLSYGLHNIEVAFEGAGNILDGQISGFYISRDNHFGWLILLLYAGLGAGAVVSGGLLTWRTGQGLYWLVPRLWQRLMLIVGWCWRYRARYAPYMMLVALVIYYFAPPMPLAIAGVLLFFLMALARPDWAILYAIMFAPLYLHPRDLRLSQSPLDTMRDLGHPRDPNDTRARLEFSLTEIIVVTTTAAWVVREFKVQSSKFKVQSSKFKVSGWLKSLTQNSVDLIQNSKFKIQNSLALPLVVFFLVACASLLVPEPSHLKEALREFRLVIVEPLLLCLLAVRFLKGRAAVWRVFDVLIGAAVVIALVGIWQFLFGRDKTVVAEGVSRVISIYNHPDNLGLFLGRIIPLAAGYVLFFGKAWAWNENRRRWLYLAALGPLMLALALAFSRGAWLGTGLALLAMIIVVGSRRGLLIYGVGLALLLAALPFIKLERITSLFSFVTGSNSTRLHVWQASLQMLRDHPLTGIGLDQFLYKYSIEYVPPEAWLERFTSHPHNLILDYWLRLGIIGPLLILWLLVIFYKTILGGGLNGKSWFVRNSQNREKNETVPALERRVLLLGLLGSMTDFVIHGMVDNSYFLVDLAIIFCLSFALVAILRRDNLAEKENN